MPWPNYPFVFCQAWLFKKCSLKTGVSFGQTPWDFDSFKLFLFTAQISNIVCKRVINKCTMHCKWLHDQKSQNSFLNCVFELSVTPKKQMTMTHTHTRALTVCICETWFTMKPTPRLRITDCFSHVFNIVLFVPL